MTEPTKKQLKRQRAQERYVAGFVQAAREAEKATREFPDSLQLRLAADIARRNLDKARRMCGMAA